MSGHIAILIPARLESTRMPEKLLRAATGRPLITYAVEAAAAARDASDGAVAEVIVATDSPAIRDAVEAYVRETGVAARAEMTAPAHRNGTERIAEVAGRLAGSITSIINIQGDEPDIPPAEILRVGALLDEHPEASMSTLARPIGTAEEWRNPHAVKVVLDRRGRCLYFSRAAIPFDRDGTRRAGEPFGHLHLGIYGYRHDVLLRYGSLPPSALEARENLEQLRALEAGLTIVAGVTDYGGAGIDTEADYQTFVERSAL